MIRSSRSLLPAIACALALLTACEKDSPDAETIVLAPQFDAIAEPFTGGWIGATDANAYADNILFARFSYFDGGHWQVIDDDSGFDLHSDAHSGGWSVYWDVSNMEGGSYRLQLELFPVEGGKLTIDQMVAVSPAPTASVVEVSRGARAVGLEASVALRGPEAVAPPGDDLLRPITHTWYGAGADTQTGASAVFPYMGEPVFVLYTATNALGASHSVPVLLAGEEVFAGPEFEEVLAEWRMNAAIAAAELAGFGRTVDDPADLEGVLLYEEYLDGLSAALMAPDINAPLPENVAAIQAAFANAPAAPPLALISSPTPVLINALSPLGNIFFQQANNPPPAPRPTSDLRTLRSLAATLARVIREKQNLRNLGNNASDRDLVVRKLKEAAAKLKQARAIITSDAARAETLIAEAREKLKEAARAANAKGQLHPNQKLIDELSAKLGLLEGRLWMKTKLGADSPYVGTGPKGLGLPDIDLDAPRNKPPHFDPNEEPYGHIHIYDSPLFGVHDDTLFHELDHSFFHQKTKAKMMGGHHTLHGDLREEEREFTDKQGNKRKRKLHLHEAEQLAFSEAWADFSSAAKRGEADFHGHDIEDFEHAKDDKGREIKGKTVEGTILELFWDLYDGGDNSPASTDSETVKIPFKYLWKALCPDDRNHPPKSIKEYYRRLIGILGMEANYTDDQFKKVDELFEACGCR